MTRSESHSAAKVYINAPLFIFSLSIMSAVQQTPDDTSVMERTLDRSRPLAMLRTGSGPGHAGQNQAQDRAAHGHSSIFAHDGHDGLD